MDELIGLHSEKIILFEKIIKHNLSFLISRQFNNPTCKLDDICSVEKSDLTESDLIDKGLDNNVVNATLRPIGFSTEKSNTPYIGLVKDGSCGKIVLMDSLTNVTSTMCRIYPKNGIELRYLYYILKTINFDKYLSGSTIKHLYHRDWKHEKCFVEVDGQKRKQVIDLLSICESIIQEESEMITTLTKY